MNARQSLRRGRFARIVRYAAGGLLVLLVLAQLVPVARGNPPVVSEVDAPPEVLTVLRKACYDCHSNETVWPWYSRVAPVSWLVARDVNEGREALNYSTWGSYPAEERAEGRDETWEEVAEGEMPLGVYLLMHPGARLSETDRAALRSWAAGATHRGEAAGGENEEDDR